MKNALSKAFYIKEKQGIDYLSEHFNELDVHLLAVHFKLSPDEIRSWNLFDFEIISDIIRHQNMEM